MPHTFPTSCSSSHSLLRLQPSSLILTQLVTLLLPLRKMAPQTPAMSSSSPQPLSCQCLCPQAGPSLLLLRGQGVLPTKIHFLPGARGPISPAYSRTLVAFSLTAWTSPFLICVVCDPVVSSTSQSCALRYCDDETLGLHPQSPPSSCNPRMS